MTVKAVIKLNMISYNVFLFITHQTSFIQGYMYAALEQLKFLQPDFIKTPFLKYFSCAVYNPAPHPLPTHHPHEPVFQKRTAHTGLRYTVWPTFQLSVCLSFTSPTPTDQNNPHNNSEIGHHIFPNGKISVNNL